MDSSDGKTVIRINPMLPETSHNEQSQAIINECKLKSLKAKAVGIFVVIFFFISICSQLIDVALISTNESDIFAATKNLLSNFSMQIAENKTKVS